MLSILTVPLLLLPCGLAQVVSLQSIVSAYNLTSASYNFSFPATTLNSDQAAAYVVYNWSTVAGKLDFGDSDIVFSPDPSTTTATLVRRQTTSKSSTTRTSTTRSSTYSLLSQTSIASPASTDLAGQPPVLRIGYPAGSYSKKTGGVQFTSNFTAAVGATAPKGEKADWDRMLLSYDVWFPNGYAWTLGGKLPGLRGGPDRFGCSGGNQTDGTGCFSTRLMWRTNGTGEVYAYIPTTNSLCTSSNIICNSDYGVSLGRGGFGFVTGQWQTIWLLVMLNDVGKANGLIELWYNGVAALSFPASTLRTSSSISSITGLFFSTFFGGDDATWASPTDQYTYFRNIQLYAGRVGEDGANPNQSDGSGAVAPNGSMGGSTRVGGGGTSAAGRKFSTGFGRTIWETAAVLLVVVASCCAML